jgi:uncharacterized protein (TIGR03083 family)
VDAELLELLRSLEPEEWDRPTVAPLWRVRDIAAHLLDTALRKLSMVRDACFVEAVEVRSQRDLVTLVNRLNQEGVTVYRRLSSKVLIDIMTVSCEQSAHFHESLDPFAPASFPVSWAGEERSLNWFDTARELTERWHHQQQIRLATNRPGGMTPEVYGPVLDCFLRGLPHLYRDFDAPAGTSLLVEVSGECGGRWFLARESSHWRFTNAPAGDIAAHVTIPQEIAWRIFTRGCDREWARHQIEVDGARDLGEKVLELTAIVA